MKNYVLLAAISALFISSCAEKPQSLAILEEVIVPSITDDVLENAVIYEANIRQYSQEGTFDAFTKDIPMLKELGVRIIWLMPIHPISMVKRKAENELSIEDISDPEQRKKYLGSPYAVADYKAVNPDFGTLEDFNELVDMAHDNDMFVIIDWVPNHTGWDNPWITEHPEYYTKNEKGEIVDPINDDGKPWGWTDVADLDYSNIEMQAAMIDAMSYWITHQNVDGFRCDVAHGVPKEFWERAIPALRAEKDVFMMAEAEIPEIMTGVLFEMSYAWGFHHTLNSLAKGEVEATAFQTYMEQNNVRWEKDDILMNFITNHDENAWAGPVKERMGAASDALLALTYCMPGMPLIYSGQEYELDRKLKFFEKDSIPKKKGKVWSLLTTLGELKNNNPALNGGKEAAGYEPIATSNDASIIAFRRSKDESEVIYLANMSASDIEFKASLSGTYIDALTGKSMEFTSEDSHQFGPWQFLILTK